MQSEGYNSNDRGKLAIKSLSYVGVFFMFSDNSKQVLANRCVFCYNRCIRSYGKVL